MMLELIFRRQDIDTTDLISQQDVAAPVPRQGDSMYFPQWPGQEFVVSKVAWVVASGSSYEPGPRHHVHLRQATVFLKTPRLM